MTNGSGKPNHLQEFVMTAKGCDFELCSGGDEDEYLVESEVHSPTDSSEDSVEVKISPICLRNKRKCAEPRKVQDAFTAPLKKRICFKAKNDSSSTSNTITEPFRPWNIETNHNVPSKDIHTIVPGPNFMIPSPQPAQLSQQMLLLQPSNYGNSSLMPHSPLYIRPSSPFETKPLIVSRSPSPTQPLSLVKKSNESNFPREKCPVGTECNLTTKVKLELNTSASSSSSCDPMNLRVPVHPHLGTISTAEAERLLVNSAEAFPNLQQPRSKINEDQSGCGSRKEQRNYKNMTRERRIEANARERTRVHTISAAFDTLRRAVPAYSHNQKLSKLSVLRIACSYIMTLSAVVDGASGLETNSTFPHLSECIDNVSKTIQKEGKLRKKKDDNERD